MVRWDCDQSVRLEFLPDGQGLWVGSDQISQVGLRLHGIVGIRLETKRCSVGSDQISQVGIRSRVRPDRARRRSPADCDTLPGMPDAYRLPAIPYLRLRVTTRAVEPAVLPEYHGSMLRGAFGHALRRTVRTMGPRQPCVSCQLWRGLRLYPDFRDVRRGRAAAVSARDRSGRAPLHLRAAGERRADRRQVTRSPYQNPTF